MDVSCGACGQTVRVPDDVETVTPCPNCRTPIDLHSVGTIATPPGGARPRIGVGQKLGGFLLEKELGRGGMGIVYQARQLSLGRTVAVKVLPEDLTASAELRARFDREAGALALLNHPNIVSIYDRGHEGGTYYFAMEYVEGKSLRQLLASRRLTPGEIVAVMDAVLQALTHAHGKGIVHRDLKPENIMMDGHGRPKVMDFGIAHLFDTPEAAALTGTRAFLGTLQYMAPEQMGAAATVDGRADIFAAGVILYEMLSGSVPRGVFKAPSEIVPGLDPAFDTIVIRALQPEPEHRYPTADEMRADIVTLAVTEGVGGGTPPPGGRAGTPRPGTSRPTLPVNPTLQVPPMARTRPVAPEPAAKGGGGLGMIVLVGALLFGGILVVAGGGTAAWFLLRPDPTPGKRTSPTKTAAPQRAGLNIKGTPVQIKTFKLFEGPKDIQNYAIDYKTRFPRWSCRYVWWEIDLGYAAPRQRIDFDLKYTIKFPDGTLKADAVNSYYLDPELVDGHMWYRGGWNDTWVPGNYSMQVYLDQTLIARGNFEIYRDDVKGRIHRQTYAPLLDIGGTTTEFYELLFYEGPKGFPPIEERVFDTSFDSTQSRYINWHIENHYPTVQKTKDYQLRWVLTSSDGSVLNDSTETFSLDPKYTTLYLSGGWGAEDAGKGWNPGVYTVTLYYGNTTVASASFEVR